ncbi:hypothetical protein [Sorangium sp. So ce117]|uniref:hypothetical protein n=1 Tax=Sorangium sp. So ce117 TaxID=3133277 RepID=UPI003F5F300B
MSHLVEDEIIDVALVFDRATVVVTASMTRDLVLAVGDADHGLGRDLRQRAVERRPVRLRRQSANHAIEALVDFAIGKLGVNDLF